MRGLPLLVLVLPISTAAASANSLVMSIHSVAAKDYERERQPNGAYVRERYAIANGGWLDGTTWDNRMEDIPFSEIAGMLAEHLGRQNYFLAKDSDSADLLLVVHWGRTIAFDETSYGIAVGDAANAYTARKMSELDSGSGGGIDDTTNTPMSSIAPEDERLEAEMLKVLLANRVRDQVNERNALLLGYIDEVNKRDGIQRWAGAGEAYEDLIADIEESRYYITVTAYDFDEMVHHKKRNVRWVTRVSIRAPGNSFQTEFPRMMASASRFFGRDTGRLIRGDKALVEIGDAQVVGITAESDRK